MLGERRIALLKSDARGQPLGRNIFERMPEAKLFTGYRHFLIYGLKYVSKGLCQTWDGDYNGYGVVVCCPWKWAFLAPQRLRVNVSTNDHCGHYVIRAPLPQEVSNGGLLLKVSCSSRDRFRRAGHTQEW